MRLTPLVLWLMVSHHNMNNRPKQMKVYEVTLEERKRIGKKEKKGFLVLTRP